MSGKSKILVVDDEDALRTALNDELTSEGYNVSTASDGDEAISGLQKETFDLVVLDVKMPRVSGLEVLKFVKEKHPETKVVMLAGFADFGNVVDVKKLGAEDFVAKPFDLANLVTTIERVLSE